MPSESKLGREMWRYFNLGVARTKTELEMRGFTDPSTEVGKAQAKAQPPQLRKLHCSLIFNFETLRKLRCGLKCLKCIAL